MNILFYTGYMHFMYSEFYFFGKRKELRGGQLKVSWEKSACLQCWVRPSFISNPWWPRIITHKFQMSMPFPPAWKIKSKLQMPEEAFSICNLLSVCFLSSSPVLALPIPHACSTLYFGHDRISILQMAFLSFHVKMCLIVYQDRHLLLALLH